MDRKKFLSPLFYVLPMTILFIALHTFLPRPIVEDVNESQIILLRYNPYYGQNTNLDDLIQVTDYDAAAVLDCLAGHTERRSLGKAREGYWVGNVQLDIVLDTDDGFKNVLLGNLNYSYQDIESPRYHIINADALIAELLALLDLDSQDYPPEA